jgi:hypothetical protein
MANCRTCGTNVGCGCQLKDGLCATCRAAVNKALKFFRSC